MHFLSRILLIMVLLLPSISRADDSPTFPKNGDRTKDQYASFPLPLDQYASTSSTSPQSLPLSERLWSRVQQDPFNLAALIIFVCAVLHTFAAGFFASHAHHLAEAHARSLAGRASPADKYVSAPTLTSVKSALFHFLGEVEAIFAIWVIPLVLCALWFHGWQNTEAFVGKDCSYTEPMFVIVIMLISASRPIVRFAEHLLGKVAQLGKGSPAAWWLSVLLLAPLLGSLITEPAAMTIAAMLLARKFYELRPGKAFAYATMGLLFVNISVGGVLTNFAAPPVLMVASKWGWSSLYMLGTFGWHAVLAVVASTLVYFAIFARQFRKLGDPQDLHQDGNIKLHWQDRPEPIPPWVTVIHLLFLAWTVFTNHYPPLFLGGFLFFMGFTQITAAYQNPMLIRGPLLVGFFLAGLVIHGSCQSWWLEPLLNNGLNEWQLMLGATILTGFNDNALITYLASQVPGLSEGLKYAVMAGAITGGGLTVIANAPNPAGQGLLRSYFGGKVNPLALLLAAIVPTAITFCIFLWL